MPDPRLEMSITLRLDSDAYSPTLAIGVLSRAKISTPRINPFHMDSEGWEGIVPHGFCNDGLLRLTMGRYILIQRYS